MTWGSNPDNSTPEMNALRNYRRPVKMSVMQTNALREQTEYLGCNEGYVFRRERKLEHGTAKLYSEDGVLLAIVPNVHTIVLAELPR
jgi:hypothetical protein